MRLSTYLPALLECAAIELGSTAPEFQIIAPGAEVAWDDSCTGILYVRVISAYPSTEFPAPDTASIPCSGPTAAAIGVGVIRCLHGIERLDQGGGPTAAELTSDALVMLADMEALFRAVECCEPTNGERRMLAQWVPIGPSGGMSGGEWVVFLDEVHLREEAS